MKRTVALVCSAVLALTLSPFVASAETPVESPSIPSAVTSEFPTVGTDPIARGDKKKKKCSYLCVQSTLPEAEIDTFFVNENRHVIYVNQDSISRWNLDLRRFTDSEPAPDGITFDSAVSSEDNDEVYVIGHDGSAEYSVFRINRVTLELHDVTPNSPTYPLGNNEYAVLPDNDGYITTVTSSGSKYLCRYTQTGAEVGCTSSFSGAGQASSGLYFHYTGDLVFALGAVDKLFTFDLRDMTFSSDVLADFDIEIGENSYADTYIWVAQNVSGPTPVTTTKMLKISTVSKTVVETVEFPGKLRVEDIEANLGFVLVAGQPYKSSGQQQKYSTVAFLDLYPTLEITKVIKINHPRRVVSGINALNLDFSNRYILASGDSNRTAVIPINSAFIEIFTEYHVCPTGWTVTWDFLNLQPGKSVKSYDMYVRADTPRAKWVKVGSVAAGGERTYELTAASSGDSVKVVARNARGYSVDVEVLETAPPIPIDGRNAARQPRC